LHTYLQKEFGFPDFYGKNVNALIDCWTSLRNPQDGMCTLTLEKDEILLLELKGLSSCSIVIMHNLLVAIESVNQRFKERNHEIPIMLYVYQ
jgi:hypothetical protein